MMPCPSLLETEFPLRIATTDPLFAWEKLPDSPDLLALRFLLELLPDRPLLEALPLHRGNGRNDYPMHVLRRTHLCRCFLRHASMEARLAELGRKSLSPTRLSQIARQPRTSASSVESRAAALN